MAQRSKSLGAPSRKSDFGNRKSNGLYFCSVERKSKQNALFSSENAFLGGRLHKLGGDNELPWWFVFLFYPVQNRIYAYLFFQYLKAVRGIQGHTVAGVQTTDKVSAMLGGVTLPRLNHYVGTWLAVSAE